MRFITGLLFTFICLLPAGSMAQNKVTLSGKVIDQHGTPIAQATIAVENTTSGTYTDDRGKYSLQVAPGKHTFVVSFLGYQTVKQSLDIRQDKKQNFTLQESAVTLSSVEVYGKTQTQKVKEGAFAVNALDIKPIVNSLNNLNDLVNRTTGIKVREEGGVGSDFDLSINGLSGNSVRPCQLGNRCTGRHHQYHYKAGKKGLSGCILRHRLLPYPQGRLECTVRRKENRTNSPAHRWHQLLQKRL